MLYLCFLDTNPISICTSLYLPLYLSLSLSLSVLHFHTYTNTAVTCSDRTTAGKTQCTAEMEAATTPLCSCLSLEEKARRPDRPS